MSEKARLTVHGKEYELPIIEGTEGELGVDIRKLRGDTGLITLDNGYANTGSCESKVCFIDGEKGILRYRGIPIEQLCEHSTFTETAYLTIYGELPNEEQYAKWREDIRYHTLLHEDLQNIYDMFPTGAHPMAVCSAVVCCLSAFYPRKETESPEISIRRLLAKMPTIATWTYKKAKGQPLVYPQNRLSYAANFLNMMFKVPTENYDIDPVAVRAMDQILIMHAEHEQNCSTSTVRMVSSSLANLFASVASGISALWGQLHGGANQRVVQMLQAIHEDGGDVSKYVAMAKDKKSGFRLMGFGHRVYKNYDPRAKILRGISDEVLVKLGVKDPLLDIAKQLEEVALSDEFFVERKLYPNVDFYSGLILRALGIPTDMFTVMFAIGRLPGWISHWKERNESPDARIYRPRQIYQGYTMRDYVPMDKRS